MGIHKERAAAPQTQANPNPFRRLSRRLISIFSRSKAPSEAIPAPIQPTRNERIRKAFKIKQAGDAIVRELEGMRTAAISRDTLESNRIKLPDALFQRYSDIHFDREVQELEVELSGATLIMIGPEKELSSIKSVEFTDSFDDRRWWLYKYIMVQDTETGAGYVAIVNRFMGAEMHRNIMLMLEKALDRAGKLCPLGGGQIAFSKESGAMEIYGLSASYGIGNHKAVRDLVREALPFAPSPS